MRVTIELPTYVEKLIEFIPAKDLESVLIEVIYDGICKRVDLPIHCAEKQGSLHEEAVSNLLSEIRTLLQGNQISVVHQEEPVTVESTNQYEQQEEVLVEDIAFDDLDLDGFDDLLK